MEDRPRLQRVRITFSKGDGLRYISHLDLARTWERVFRRARLPVAYSQGFNPRQRFQIAAALPVGVVGNAELLDVWLLESLPPEEVLGRLGPALPSGLGVSGAAEVELRSPSLQSQMRSAEYRAILKSPEPVEAIQGRVQGLLQAATLPRRRHHKGKMQTYDLRPLIRSIDVESAQDPQEPATNLGDPEEPPKRREPTPGQTTGAGGTGHGDPEEPPSNRGDRHWAGRHWTGRHRAGRHGNREQAPGIPWGQVLTMCLQASPERAGRPDEVLDALGLSMVIDSIERTNLNFEFDK